MAVVASNDSGWVISHELFINQIYEKTVSYNDTKSYKINPALFDIQAPFVKSKNTSEDLKESIEDVKIVENACETLSTVFESEEKNLNEEQRRNSNARSLCNSFYCNSNRDCTTKFQGGNNSIEALVCVIENESYLIPKNCKFFCYDVKNVSQYLENEEYDFIVIDPPWWNKYVRRKKKKNWKFGYEMMFDKDLVNVPINSLLRNGGIVAVWCTNAPSHINSILTELFPAWNLQHVSQWFWLKVTKFGKPICGFSKTSKKQPFERIIFGVKNNSDRCLPNPDKNKVIMSIPSAIHSHKPPLVELLKSYLPKEPKCLELFARYLLPGWTSYGNEVLKLQHISLYNEFVFDTTS